MGEILREDLGDEGLHCGLEEAALGRVASQREASLHWSVLQTMFGKRTCVRKRELMRMTMPMMSMASKIVSRQPWFEGQPRTPQPFFSQDTLRKSEVPSAIVHANARSLAKLASALANKGQPPDGEKRHLSEQTWEKMHSEPLTAMDANLRKSKV